MTEDERDQEIARVTKEMIDVLRRNVENFKDTGWRGFSDIETDIYNWIHMHAEFE